MRTDVPPLAVLGARGSTAPGRVLDAMRSCAAQRYAATSPAEFPEALLVQSGALVPHTVPAAADVLAATTTGGVSRASVVGVASITAYQRLDTLAEVVRPELIDLPRAVAVAAQQRRRRYLLLGCPSSSRVLYPYLLQLSVQVTRTRPDEQREIDEVLRLVAMNEVAGAGQHLLRLLFSRADDDYDALLLGCPELSVAVAVAQRHECLPALDSVTVLAEALTARYYELVERPATYVLGDSRIVL